MGTPGWLPLLQHLGCADVWWCMYCMPSEDNWASCDSSNVSSFRVTAPTGSLTLLTVPLLWLEQECQVYCSSLGKAALAGSCPLSISTCND